VLYVSEGKRSPQKGIVVEIDLADRQIVGGTPMGIHRVEKFRG
jgi:hypothetical protein